MKDLPEPEADPASDGASAERKKAFLEAMRALGTEPNPERFDQVLKALLAGPASTERE